MNIEYLLNIIIVTLFALQEATLMIFMNACLLFMLTYFNRCFNQMYRAIYMLYSLLYVYTPT